MTSPTRGGAHPPLAPAGLSGSFPLSDLIPCGRQISYCRPAARQPFSLAASSVPARLRCPLRRRVRSIMPRGARGRASRMAYLARQRARAADRAGQQRRRSPPRQEPPRRGYWAWHELSDREPDEISTVDYEIDDRADEHGRRLVGEATDTPAVDESQPPEIEVLDVDEPLVDSDALAADGVGGPSSTALWVDELIRGSFMGLLQLRRQAGHLGRPHRRRVRRGLNRLRPRSGIRRSRLCIRAVRHFASRVQPR